MLFAYQPPCENCPSSLAQRILTPLLLPYPLGQRASARWPQSFFRTTSPRMCFVERGIGHQALQTCVLLTQLTHLAHFGHPEFAVLLLPQIKARFAHPELPADIGHRRAALRLAQRVGDLLFGVSLALNGPLLPKWRTSSAV